MPGLDLGHVPPDLSRHEPEIQNGAHAGRNLTAGPGKESHSGKKNSTEQYKPHTEEL